MGIQAVGRAIVDTLTGNDIQKKTAAAAPPPTIPLGINGNIPLNRDGATWVGDFASLPKKVGPTQAAEEAKNASEEKLALLYLKQFQRSRSQRMQVAAQHYQLNASHAIGAMRAAQQVEQTDLRVGEAMYQYGFQRQVNRATVSGWEAAYQQAEAIW